MKAVKNDQSKPVISFIPAEYIEGTAAVFTFGAKKYAAHNYRHGMAHSRLLDAAMRHLLAILRGEELDPESGLPHVYHASCSLAMYDYMRTKFPELNDIFELTKKENQTCQTDSTQPQTLETPKLKGYDSSLNEPTILNNTWIETLANLEKLY